MKTKKRSSFKMFYEIRCESTKITKLRAVSMNLGVSGLDLHSKIPEPVNFFGAQSSLGGYNFRLGGHGLGMPPVAPGLFQFPVLKVIREIRKCFTSSRDPRIVPFALLYNNTINNKRTNNICTKFGTNRLTNELTLAYSMDRKNIYSCNLSANFLQTFLFTF